MVNERQGREGECAWMRGRWGGEGDIDGDGGRRWGMPWVRGGKSVTRWWYNSKDIENSVKISNPNAWASVKTKNEKKKKKLRRNRLRYLRTYPRGSSASPPAGPR